jgi:hypothetical protein
MVQVTHRLHSPAPPPMLRSIARAAGAVGHDLPVLAAAHDLPKPVQWEPLLARGVEPAMFLGAERRWSGKR